jgi:hypothetical protein
MPMPADPSTADSGAASRSGHRIRRSLGASLAALSVLAPLPVMALLFAKSAGATPGVEGATPLLPAAFIASGSTPAHIETWAIDDGCSGGGGASSALVRRWLTVAESNCGPLVNKANRDCQTKRVDYCSVVQYMDTDWIYADALLPLPRKTPSDWWLHAPGSATGARIFGHQEGGGYLLNQSVPAVRDWFSDYVRRYYNADTGLVMDDQSPSLSEELYYSTCGCKTTHEIASDSVLRAAHNAMSAALKHRNGSQFLQVDNTLAPNPFLPQGLNMLDSAAGVDGLIAEGEPEQYGGVMDPYYSTLLDQIAYIQDRTAAFVVPMSHGYANAPTLMQSRRVQEATVLLGFEPDRIVDWADLEVGSTHLSVWPEEGIYPSEPLESMQAPGGNGCLAGTGVVCSTGGHNDLEVAPGIYRREFGSCALYSVAFGPCAAVVNSTAAPVAVRSSWLRQNYGHVVTLVGGDVQSGGRISLKGAAFSANSTVVPAHDALLLSR